MSILDHAYDIIIYQVVGATGHVWDIVDVLNTTKRFKSNLMENVQMPDSIGYCDHMETRTTK